MSSVFDLSSFQQSPHYQDHKHRYMAAMEQDTSRTQQVQMHSQRQPSQQQYTTMNPNTSHNNTSGTSSYAYVGNPNGISQSFHHPTFNQQQPISARYNHLSSANHLNIGAAPQGPSASRSEVSFPYHPQRHQQQMQQMQQQMQTISINSKEILASANPYSFILYIKHQDGPSMNALSLAKNVDGIQIVDAKLIPVEKRPVWLKTVPTLVCNKTYQVFTGTPALNKIKEFVDTKNSITTVGMARPVGDGNGPQFAGQGLSSQGIMTVGEAPVFLSDIKRYTDGKKISNADVDSYVENRLQRELANMPVPPPSQSTIHNMMDIDSQSSQISAYL